MTAPWQDAVRPTAEAMLGERSVPGVVIAVARGGDEPTYLVTGEDGAGRPLAPDTLFPVASITKLATALAVLRLVAAGNLALDDSLVRHLPDATAAAAGVTLRDLLSHTAGLPDDLPPGAAPYAVGLGWPALARACLATPAVGPRRTRVRYGNVGCGLLAVVVERATGSPFPAALADLVLTPLGIEGYLGVEPPRSPAVVAGEYGEHAGTALEPFNSAFWRSLALPWGGLVTTAAGALALVRAFAGQPPGFLPPALAAEATRDQTAGLPGEMVGLLRGDRFPWGLGAEVRGEKSPHWTPDAASAGSFGHAGASGCVAWLDPAVGLAWSVLGTRTFETWWRSWPPIGQAILTAAR